MLVDIQVNKNNILSENKEIRSEMEGLKSTVILTKFLFFRGLRSATINRNILLLIYNGLALVLALHASDDETIKVQEEHQYTSTFYFITNLDFKSSILHCILLKTYFE